MNRKPLHGWILTPSGESHELGRVCEGARAYGVDIDIIAPKAVDLLLDPNHSELVWVSGEEKPRPQFAIAGFVEEPDYFNLALMRQLEIQGVVCINPVEAMLNSGDKLRTLQLLATGGLPVPRTLLWKPGLKAAVVRERLGLPVVMKLLRGSRGQGVFLVHSLAELNNYLDLVQYGGVQDEVIFQELISSTAGRDLRIMVIDGRARACMLRRSGSVDGFKANISQGGHAEAYPLNDEIRRLAEESARLLGLIVGGIDLLFAESGYVVCESNSIPGFKGLESCCDIDVPAEILRCVARLVAAQARGSEVTR